MNIQKRLEEIGVVRRIKDLNEIMKDSDPKLRKTLQKSAILDALYVDEELAEEVNFQALDRYIGKLVNDIIGFQSSKVEVKELNVDDNVTLSELMDIVFKKKGESNE